MGKVPDPNQWMIVDGPSRRPNNGYDFITAQHLCLFATCVDSAGCCETTVVDNQTQQFWLWVRASFLCQTKARSGFREVKNIEKHSQKVIPMRFLIHQIFGVWKNIKWPLFRRRTLCNALLISKNRFNWHHHTLRHLTVLPLFAYRPFCCLPCEAQLVCTHELIWTVDKLADYLNWAWIQYLLCHFFCSCKVWFCDLAVTVFAPAPVLGMLSICIE